MTSIIRSTFILPVLAIGASTALGQAVPASATAIPVRYDENRWVVRPVTTSGDTLELYTDSGGGMIMFVRDALRNMNPTLAFSDTVPGGDTVFTTRWPTFRTDATIPAPLGGGTPDSALVMSAATVKKAGVPAPARDGFLGSAWFAGRIWRFDYPGHRLTLLPASTPVPNIGGHTVALGFRDAPTAAATPNFARLQVTVDGEPLDLLFDTGATTMLTDSATAAISDGHPASRAASFIARNVFDRWHARHPNWRVVLHAEARSGADMIEVPAVTVAGLTAGPVWFTARPDKAFHEFMSQWMDQRVEGAFGGSGLKYFVVTVDYPHRRATFEKPGQR